MEMWKEKERKIKVKHEWERERSYWVGWGHHFHGWVGEWPSCWCLDLLPKIGIYEFASGEPSSFPPFVSWFDKFSLSIIILLKKNSNFLTFSRIFIIILFWNKEAQKEHRTSTTYLWAYKSHVSGDMCPAILGLFLSHFGWVPTLPLWAQLIHSWRKTSCRFLWWAFICFCAFPDSDLSAINPFFVCIYLCV